MAINYSVTPRKNPKNPQDPAKYYARTQVTSEYSFDDLCSDLQAMCTLTEGDIKATTANMVHCISSALRNGRSVRMGELGLLRIVVSSTGAETKEAFTAANIRKPRIAFYAGNRLREAVAGLRFKQVEPRPQKGSENGQEDDGQA